MVRSSLTRCLASTTQNARCSVMLPLDISCIWDMGKHIGPRYVRDLLTSKSRSIATSLAPLAPLCQHATRTHPSRSSSVSRRINGVKISSTGWHLDGDDLSCSKTALSTSLTYARSFRLCVLYTSELLSRRCSTMAGIIGTSVAILLDHLELWVV